MAFTQSQLDALESSIAQGALTVRYSDGRLVTYQSLSDMLRLRDKIRSEIGVESPASARGRILNIPMGRGL